MRRSPLHRREAGAAMIIFAVSITGLLGLAALAIDQGMMWDAKQRAQNVADAAALAAGQGLTGAGGSTATATANATAVINACNKSTYTFKSKTGTYVTFPTSVTADSGSVYTVSSGTCARVDGYVNAPVSFGRAVGFWPSAYDGTQGMVSAPAHATVMVANFGSGVGVLPFGAVADQPTATDHDLAYIATLLTSPPQIGVYNSTDTILKSDTMKGSSIQASGNFGAIDLPGSKGASDYRANISNPSTATVSVGDVLDTETGNMVGPTQQGVSNRLATTNNNFTHYFSSYDEWFFGRSTDPTTGKAFSSYYVTLPDGSQHIAYNDPEKQNSTDAHLGIIPLISSPSKNGKAQVTVMGFGVVFLDSSATDSSAVVTGHFVGVLEHGTGSSSGGGGAYVLRLIQ